MARSLAVYALGACQGHYCKVLSTLSCPQGYGAVSPTAGLTLLRAVLHSNLPSGVVAINPFDWAVFLRGALPCLRLHHEGSTAASMAQLLFWCAAHQAPILAA